MLDLNQYNLTDFFLKYIKIYKTFKASFIANRFMKDIMKIDPDLLRAKKKDIETIEIKNDLIRMFKKIIKNNSDNLEKLNFTTFRYIE